LFLCLACLVGTLSAQSLKFEDVHIWVSKNPSQEGSRRDGILNFVSDAKAVVTVINAEDEVAQVIPYASITKIEYSPDAGHRIRIYYKNADGEDRMARLNLHGGNRKKIVKAFDQAGLTLVVAPK
jgi:hypothetical protein